MRSTLTIALGALLVSAAMPAYAQTIISPDGTTRVVEPRAPVYVEPPAPDPGEPTVGAGELPRADTLPEGSGRARTTLPDGAVLTTPGGTPPEVLPPPRRPDIVVGSRGLLRSLSELDKPLTPEEITAYGAFVQREIPLRPELILDLRRRKNAVERAQSAPATGRNPSSITDSIRVSLSTQGEAIPLATSQGVASVVSFFDRTGAAWPVASYVIGDEREFQVNPLQEGSNQIAISPLTRYGYSNLIISLVGTAQPLTIEVESSDEIVHFRRDVTVNGVGPNAKIAPVVAKVKDPDMRSSDGLMMAVVQGAPIPPNATELTTDDADVEAYKIGDNYYIRTNQVLISPSYDAAVSGPGGINAYRLNPAPVALITRAGKVTKVRITQ